MKKIEINQLSIILIMLVVCSSSVFAQTLKIMPLGNSITRGSAGSYNASGIHVRIGYRGKLDTLLTNAGYSINLVGSESDGTGIPDPDHEGHSGYITQQIRDTVHKWLNNNQADIVLLHIGTNDIINGLDSITMKNEVGQILDTIKTFYSNTSVIVAQIINRADVVSHSTKSKMISGYNRELNTLINNRISGGDKLALVDMEDGAGFVYSIDNTVPFTTGDLWDSTSHPNQRGYNKMADNWFSAIQTYFTPNLLNPIAGNDEQPINPVLSWSAPKGYYSSTKYKLQVSTSSSFPSGPSTVEFANLSNTFYQVTGLNYSTTYYWRVNSTNYGGTSYWSQTWSFKTILPVYVKVFLQGPYNSSTSKMDTSLKQNNLIPKSRQPYYNSPWNYNGYESIASVPSGIVDWILVELRSTYNGVAVAQRAAFVKNDGTVVDTNGTSPVSFSGISPGFYYILIRHRNHLAVMSKDSVSLPNSAGSFYNFTNTLTKAYGNSAMVLLGDGNYGMYAGDANGDGIVRFTGSNNDKASILSIVGLSDLTTVVSGLYSTSDLNMDGRVTFTGANNDKAMILTNVGLQDLTNSVNTQIP